MPISISKNNIQSRHTTSIGNKKPCVYMVIMPTMEFYHSETEKQIAKMITNAIYAY
jgi:hypothetical protein